MLAWTQFFVAALVGGLLALERRAFLQAMLSRPLVAATVTGALLGDLRTGLLVGMVLELFHLGSASLGAALPENDTLAATGTAAAAAAMTTVNVGSTPAMCSLAILVFAPLGPAGRALDRRLDRYAARLVRTSAKFAEQGNLSRAVRQNLWGMWPFFAAHGTVTALCFVTGGFISLYVDLMPLQLLRGLAWAYPAMASVGAAIAVRGSHARRAYLIAGVAAVMVIVLATLVPLVREAM